MCMVSKGSREIWVYEKASDKNAIGKIDGLIKFSFYFNDPEEQSRILVSFTGII